MAVRKTKIVFEQHDLVNYSVYRVVNLTNRTDPIIGTELKKAEVDKLIQDANLENLTVEIRPRKK